VLPEVHEIDSAKGNRKSRGCAESLHSLFVYSLGGKHDCGIKKRHHPRAAGEPLQMVHGHGPVDDDLRGGVPHDHRPYRRYEQGGHRSPGEPFHHRIGQADQRTLQESQPEVPCGVLRRERGRHALRRRALPDHRRTLFRGIQGADPLRGPKRQSFRRDLIARRRVQAAHLSLRLPGPARGGHRPPAGSQKGDRPSHRDGDHEYQRSGAL